MAILLTKEPVLISIGHLQTPQAWVALAGALTFGVVLMVPLCNLLGFDRGGIRTWWLLPLRDRDLWLGKVAGTAAYAALALPVLLIFLVQAQALRLHALDRAGGLDLTLEAGTHPLGAAAVLALALLLAILFLWWAGSGLKLSLAGASPMGLGTYGVQPGFTDEKVARLGVLFAPLLWIVPLFAVASLLGPAVLFPVLALLGTWSGLRFSRKLDQVCAAMDGGREELTTVLSAG